MDPNALKAALGQAIDALSQVADMVAGDAGGAPAPGGAPGAPAPGGAPPAGAAPGGPPKKPEEEDANPAAGKGMGDGQDMLQGMPGGAPSAPSVCPACGRPLEAHDGQPQQPMMQSARKAATGDMSYGDMPAADGPGDMAGGQEGAVIKGARTRKSSEPSGSDQFRPGKPEGKVPHDEGSNMGLGAPANPGNTRSDTSQSGVEGAVIKSAGGGGDLKTILEGLINPLTESLNDLHDRLGAVEQGGTRQGRKALAKSASPAPMTETSEGYEIAADATELPTEVWRDVLMGRTSIGDNSL